MKQPLSPAGTTPVSAFEELLGATQAQRSKRKLYSDALGAAICERVARGETLTEITRELKLGDVTIWVWRKAYPKFGDALEEALEHRADIDVEMMQELSQRALALHKDKSALGVKRLAALGPILRNLEWRAAVRNRQRYGAKQEVGLSGGLTLQINTAWAGKTIVAEPVVEDEDTA